jgi:hypothetical protein
MGIGRDGGADLRPMRVHGVRVAPRQNEADGLASGRTDRAEDVDRQGALIVWRTGPGPAPGPAACDLVLLADPGIVLEPELDLQPRLEAGVDRCDFFREVFFNASAANAFWG